MFMDYFGIRTSNLKEVEVGMLLSNDFSCVGIEVTGGDQVTGGDRDFGTFLCLEET